MSNAKKLVCLLKEKQMKISCAESLTGGLVSKKITDIPGASAVFECGVCSYSNRIKHQVLGVSEQILRQYSEYSLQCAAEMAKGVRRLAGSDIGVSTSGIAGPGGSTAEKPVGTVYVGVSTKDDTKAFALCLGEEKTREEIRELASDQALQLALNALENRQID